MARWDDLRRAVLARDTDATERIWFELLEGDPGDPAPYFDVAALAMKQPGGKRQASGLLWILADVLKDKGRHAALISLYGMLAGCAPDGGELRAAVVEAAQAAYPDREDLELLLERSGIIGGSPAELETQIGILGRYLRIECGAYVFHKSGWGVGQVSEYHPDRGRCVIDFRTRPGHEMDIEAAAKLLERLDEGDIRVLAMEEPRKLRALAKEQPLEMLRQALARYSNSAALRNVREALVPDAVAASNWSTWWKGAKKQALLDPRFDVGGGRDPRLAFQDMPQADFQTQVVRALKRSATPADRQRAVRDLMTVVSGDEEARSVLSEAVREQFELTRDPAVLVGWELILADLTDRDPVAGMAEALASAANPLGVVRAIEDDTTRAQGARALLQLPERGPELLQELVLLDDPAAANVSVEGLPKAGRPELLTEILDRIDQKPALLPNLYAWFVRGLRRKRWEGRTYKAGRLVLRLLKVLDAVEYRARRKPVAKDKKAVSALCDILTDKECAILQEAVVGVDEPGAHHLLMMLGQNRGLKARSLQKLQNVVLRAHPHALREVEADDPDEEVVANELYMTGPGLERLRAEHDRIANEEMPANSKEIARAREFGDLSENAEYHAAREKQGLLQAKVNVLKSDIARAVIISPDIVRVDAVSVGSRVKVRDPEGQENSYALLGPPDADVERGVISYLTPLGQALMGREPGDQVRIEVSGKVREVEVLEIANGLE